MQIFAAIDLKDGKCVRLTQGDPAAESIYSDDPTAVAEGQEELEEQLKALGYLGDDEEVEDPHDP